MNRHIQLTVDGQGVATLAIDLSGRSVNLFTAEFTGELHALVNEIARRVDVVGAVITSAKSTGFMAGADLGDFAHVHARGLSSREAAALVAPASAALRALERCGKPVAAAINGFALGGGLELCLACHHRVLADDPSAVVGLPEVTVGLLPAGGGTQRLPRLIGIPTALPLLLSGRRLAGVEALRLGVVDALVAPNDVLAVARQWVMEHPGFLQPWDRKGYAIPGGAGALATHANESFGVGMARLRRDTQDNEPAPAAILASVYEGTQLPIDGGLAVELDHFGVLLAGPVARNIMRTLFLNKSAIRRRRARPANIAEHSVRRLGVLGAGMMGAGIAHVAAAAGIDVVVLERAQDAALSGSARIAASAARDAKAGRCSTSDVDSRLSRVRVTTDYAELQGCDFVIEAVFEERAIKIETYRRLLDALSVPTPGLVLASNTSTLPIAGLARHWVRPESFIGLHFFSPVERMELLEVIVGPRTAPAALARALDLASLLGKLPIVVNDSPGFYTSRIFCAYIDEGMAMLAEGVPAALIENAARQAGYATGPLAVTDEVSLDLQQAVLRQAVADGLPAKFLRQHAQPVVDALVARGRLGRKCGHGFHDFVPGEPKRLWSGLGELFPTTLNPIGVEEVAQRLLGIQALESARCMEERVLCDPADADLGSILALGFPRWTGGTLSYIETVGVREFVARCERMADRYGERFRPSPWLHDRAATGQPFHDSGGGAMGREVAR